MFFAFPRMATLLSDQLFLDTLGRSASRVVRAKLAVQALIFEEAISPLGFVRADWKSPCELTQSLLIGVIHLLESPSE